MAALQMVKHSYSAIPVLAIHSRKIKAYIRNKLDTQLFLKMVMGLNSPQIHQWMSKL